MLRVDGCVLLLAFVGAVGESIPCVEASCGTRGAETSLLQRGRGDTDSFGLGVTASGFEPTPGRATAAEDAQFLIRATFGPTASSLAEKSTKSKKQWIRDQMGLPASSHRVWYRERTNPAFRRKNSALPEEIGTVRGPCRAGARWIEYALRHRDKNSGIEVRKGSQIWISGRFRASIQPGSYLSTWEKLGDWKGKVCAVSESPGGDVVITAGQTCWDTITVPNPPPFSRTATSLDLDLDPIKKGAGALVADIVACALTVSDKDVERPLIVKSKDKYFAYDPRYVLLDNAPERPSNDYAVCPAVHFLNEQNCQLPKFNFEQSHRVSGFKGELFEEFGRLPSEWPTLTTVDEIIVPTINFWNNQVFVRKFPTLRFGTLFSAKFTAKLLVTKPGLYEFFLESDDGSKLWINQQEVAHNRVLGNMQGSVKLAQGEHDVVVEYFQVRGWAMLKLSYKGPDSNNQRVIIPNTVVRTPPQVFTGCFLSCGSPGEVANKPSAGHQITLRTSNVRGSTDFALDNKYNGNWKMTGSKQAVWVNRILTAPDQLRQRMAWALSQIFVVSERGQDLTHLTEMWVHYYDLFVRHAFGNFWDVLTSVTFSGVMGQYLTHAGSTSLDSSGRNPNENYARELMQLFTIGLEKLNADGTLQTDGDGKPVPTYNQKHIVNFARVFTGFRYHRYRPNIESTGGVNKIDPMWIDVSKHDVHPKPDLDGGYIGDGFPLCTDPLPPRSYLLKGSRYEFKGHFGIGKAHLVLEDGSALLAALCGGAASAANCSFSPVVTLADNLGCSECDADVVHYVRIGHNMHYQYVPPVCVHPWGPARVTVDSSGDVTDGVSKTTFNPVWIGGQPAPGSAKVTFSSAAVFTTLPNPSELHALKVGAFAPTTACSDGCDGDVKVYFGPSGVIDEDTVFEHGGKFFKNIEMMLSYGVTSSKFRSPPVFVRTTKDNGVKKSVLAEILALLDHLYRHPNTRVFIGTRLIQRFGISTPSPQYVHAVADAFATGAFDGMTFSGKYGDLAATITAVLLYPAAQGNTNLTVSYNGALREPILKMMHFMRSMEYTDKQKQLVAYTDMMIREIGQFPYESPTVFNYYTPTFALPVVRSRKAEPEPEPELAGPNGTMEPEPEPELAGPNGTMEPEPEPELAGPNGTMEPEPEPELAGPNGTMEPEPEPELAGPNGTAEPEPEPEPENAVGPEFQILTPGYMVGYWNSMDVLLNQGVSQDCALGPAIGTKAAWSNGSVVCPQGAMAWEEADTVDGTINQLDLLLTGGRLTPRSKNTIKAVYETSVTGEKLQKAQQAISMTAEFNTIGDTAAKTELRPRVEPKPPAAPSDYKAVVMLYLEGGADSWNMLVPRGCDLQDEYMKARGDLALQNTETLAVATSGQDCQEYGIHASLSYVKTLYDAGDAAFVSNIGALVEPLTLEQYKAGAKQHCPALFSHQHQSDAAHTLKCQDGLVAGGNGGRLADAISGNVGLATTSFSLAGTATWPRGKVTGVEMVEKNAPRFHKYGQWRDVLGNITVQTHGNAYAEAYSQALSDAIESTERIGKSLESSRLKTAYRTDTSLQEDLKQVARLISVRGARGAQRDLFYLGIAGWDHHTRMKAFMRNGLDAVNAAIKGFAEEMKQQGLWNNVVLLTYSEFGRTLDSNHGGGSDHGWAGQQIIAGGAVRGGRVLNRYPASIAAGGPTDVGRGVMIPEYPWESMMVPIAKWMGMLDKDAAAVFPNLHNFNATTHIIADLFE